MRGHEAAQHLDTLSARIQVEISALEKIKTEALAAQAQVLAEQKAVCTELARSYLAALTPEWLASAEQRTGYRGFSRRDPLKALEKERTQLQHAIARLVADPRYTDQERLIGPYGKWTLKIKEIEDLLQPWEIECQRFESQEGFLELVEVGYDTPEFAERWWQPSYWRHWAAGDRICAALQMADFGDDVLPAWKKVATERDKLRRQRDAFVAERNGVVELLRSVEAANQRLAGLDGIYYEEAVQQLGTHLLGADIGLLDQWRGEDRAVEVGLKRLSVLEAKRQYFVDVVQRGIPEVLDPLVIRAAKMQVKSAKLRRPKRWNMEVGNPEPELQQKLDRMATQREKLRAANQRVMGWQDYQRWQMPVQPVAWWPIILPSPPPYAPGVRDWYTRNPDVQGTRAPEEVAVVERSFDSAGDLS